MVNSIRRLRNCVVWALAGLLCAGGVAAGKDRFPYTVYTVADDTPVYSGPGESFYATDMLPAGTAIEVHKREPGGWLAVRPPEKSFSWVPGRKLHVAVGDRSARVIADDAVSWIGSRVETVADHCWQVPLDRGERIVVLGHRELTDDKKGTTETWYQIAPPNGEFRWIHAEDVQRHRPGGGDVPLAANESDANTGADAEEGVKRDGAASSETRQASAETPARRNENKAGSRDSQVAPVQYRAEWSPRAAARPARRMDVASVPSTEVPAATTSPEISRELEDLQLLMTQLSTQEPGLWNLAPLRARAEMLIDRGANPLERGKARLMLEKIEEYEELQQRHIRTERNVSLPPAAAAASGFTGISGLSGGATENVSTPVGSGLAAIGLSSLAKTFSSGADATPATSASPRVEPRFDGTGWLLPVHSTKRVAPPYALLDDQGKVLQYVTPSPGVNLHRFERKRVGVYGQKGNVATLNAPHLTAHRIVDLDRQSNRSR